MKIESNVLTGAVALNESAFGVIGSIVDSAPSAAMKPGLSSGGTKVLNLLFVETQDTIPGFPKGIVSAGSEDGGPGGEDEAVDDDDNDDGDDGSKE
ncbi:hypothetical protein [Pendulispora albinea]|uniref:Uncharacterized protein n=1 Tax=Pendulispora albinea TaxID=2741071 RepID=A0ABZ2LIV1_9BACT